MHTRDYGPRGAPEACGVPEEALGSPRESVAPLREGGRRQPPLQARPPEDVVHGYAGCPDAVKQRQEDDPPPLDVLQVHANAPGAGPLCSCR